MEERKINLEEIILRHFHGFTKEQYQELKTRFPYCELNAILIDVCRQTLELATENAEAWCYAEGNEPEYGVDKQSILNTINQIE